MPEGRVSGVSEVEGHRTLHKGMSRTVPKDRVAAKKSVTRKWTRALFLPPCGLSLVVHHRSAGGHSSDPVISKLFSVLSGRAYAPQPCMGSPSPGTPSLPGNDSQPSPRSRFLFSTCFWSYGHESRPLCLWLLTLPFNTPFTTKSVRHSEVLEWRALCLHESMTKRASLSWHCEVRFDDTS